LILKRVQAEISISLLRHGDQSRFICHNRYELFLVVQELHKIPCRDRLFAKLNIIIIKGIQGLDASVISQPWFASILNGISMQLLA